MGISHQNQPPNQWMPHFGCVSLPSLFLFPFFFKICACFVRSFSSMEDEDDLWICGHVIFLKNKCRMFSTLVFLWNRWISIKWRCAYSCDWIWLKMSSIFKKRFLYLKDMDLYICQWKLTLFMIALMLNNQFSRIVSMLDSGDRNAWGIENCVKAS